MFQMLEKSGLQNYNIIRYGLKLFGYYKTDYLNKSITFISNSEKNKKWSEYMEPIMKVDIDPKTNFPYLLPLQMHLDRSKK